MTDICFIQPIFCPDANQLDRCLESLHSLEAYLKAVPDEKMDLYIAGWVPEDDAWASVKTIVDRLPRVKWFQRYTTNAGKAVIVNTLYSQHAKPNGYAYMLSADSDIIFKADQRNMLSRLKEAVRQVTKHRKSPCGVIALELQGCCCHHPMSRQVKTVLGRDVFLAQVGRWRRGR